MSNTYYNDTIPDADMDLSCKSETPPSNPDVVVDVEQGDEWVRIPVTGVEEWINKDGPADMSRTAKVTFPFEWGGEGIIDYINGFNSTNLIAEQNDPYDECRIFFYDEEEEGWIINHYGYVGGVGPSSEGVGLGKFWVYDPADLMKAIQVSKSWAEPSLSNVIEFALRGTDDRGRDVGIEKRSVFDSGEVDVMMVGQHDIPKEKQADIRDIDPDGFTAAVGPFRVDMDGLFGDFFEFVSEEVLDPLLRGQKHFHANRNNMVDHMEWMTDLIDARWWFEPSVSGPVLTIDATAYKSGQGKNTYERRYFVDDEALDDWREVQRLARLESAAEFAQSISDGPDFDYRMTEAQGEFGENLEDIPNDYLPAHNYEVFATIDTLNNNALVDIKPFNTVVLKGESSTYRERYTQGDGILERTRTHRLAEDIETSTEYDNKQDFANAASPGGYTEEYPHVTVTYEPLIERAGGYEYSAQTIESDKVYLSEAADQARKEFRKHLAEATEGSMQLLGEPHIMPYDYIVTLPTCNDTYLNANAKPMAWEVNAVKHTRMAGERYTTELGVSIAVEDRYINTSAEYKQA